MIKLCKDQIILKTSLIIPYFKSSYSALYFLDYASLHFANAMAASTNVIVSSIDQAISYILTLEGEVLILSLKNLFPDMPRTQLLVDTSFDLAKYLFDSWTELCKEDQFMEVVFIIFLK